ncbi:MAG: hypothetical protein B7Z45_09395 [Azorhizobium sp. 12-66-6]|nr:MAG: hypothetical protein B7Z45_09395 [Azorhizobium sp. 12-66-6]
MARKVISALGGNVRGKTAALLGLTFKPNTDDMRDSPAISIVNALLDKGMTIRAYDPEGMEEARKVLPGEVQYGASPYEIAEGADCLVIITEWDAFRALDFDRLKQIMAQPVLVDLRNIYVPSEMADLGFRYESVGRPTGAGHLPPLNPDAFGSD